MILRKIMFNPITAVLVSVISFFYAFWLTWAIQKLVKEKKGTKLGLNNTSPSVPQDTGISQSTDDALKPKMSFGKKLTIFLSIVLFLGITGASIGIISSNQSSNSSSNQTSKTSPTNTQKSTNNEYYDEKTATSTPAPTSTPTIEKTILKTLPEAYKYIIDNSLIPQVSSKKISKIKIIENEGKFQWDFTFIDADNTTKITLGDDGDFEIDKFKTYTYDSEFWSSFPNPKDSSTDKYIDLAKEAAKTDGMTLSDTMMVVYEGCTYCSYSEKWEVGLVDVENIDKNPIPAKRYSYEDGELAGKEDINMTIY